MSIPSIVTGIVVRNACLDNSYIVTWNSSLASYSVSLYNIYRSECQYDGFELVSTLPTLTLTFIDKYIPYSFYKQWYYKVSAVNASGESNISNMLAVTDYDYNAFSKRFPPYESTYNENL